MKPEELAAYIGAAAWLPQIAVWIYRAAVRPRLRVIPNQFAEVGFTTYGPIFNVRMAFLVEHQDLIIDGLDLTVRHEDGESRTFRWAGLGETFSEITDSAGNKQIVSKDQSPIAIKVVVQALLEKFVRFQEPRFHQADSATTRALVTHFNFVKQKSPEIFVAEVLASKEFFSVVEGRQKWFAWKPGNYSLQLHPTSPQKFRLINPNYSFELTPVDVEHLRRNLPVVETEIRNVISSNLPDHKAEPLHWQWANVLIQGRRDASQETPLK
jgi:hypothetical protein